MKGHTVISLRTRIAPRSRLLLASAVLALAGCQAEYATGGPVYAEAPSGGGAAVTVAAGPTEADADSVYDPEPPVADIETYPSAVYDGVTVYYVGDRWYRRGPRGWAYFREEPPELGRQRAMHERDPRWVQARERPMRPGVAEPQAPERPERVDAPRSPAPPTAGGKREEKEEPTDTKAPPPKRRAPPKRAPRPAPVGEERR